MDGFVYDNAVYDMQTSISTCSTFLMYALLFTFVLGIAGRKLIALEMIIQAQLIYYSLITIPKPNPSFVGLMGMKFMGGFYFRPENLTQQTIPQGYTNLGFSSNFIANFNIMLVTILLCPILAGLFYFVSSRTKTIRMNKKLVGYAKQSILELLLYFCIFNTWKVLISWIINLRWAEGQIGGIVFGAVVMLMISGSVISLALLRSHYVQFNDEFHVEKQCRIYIYVLIAKVFLFSVLLGLESSINYSIYAVIVIEIGFVVYTGVARPHIQYSCFVRQLVNTSVTVGALVIITYYGQASKNYTEAVIPTVYLPIIILILLFVLLVLNLGFILKHIVTEYVMHWVRRIKQYKLDGFKTQQPVALQATISNDPLVTINYQMMQTMKMHNSNFSSRRKLQLSHMVERTDQDQDDEMQKKLQYLKDNFS